MKKFPLLLILLIIVSGSINAQLKIGYVDSKTIMKELDDAKDVQQRMDALVLEWKDDLKKLENDLKAMEDDFERRKLILSTSKKRELEKEIRELKDQISDFKQKKFGVNGELFKKQEELMKPVQNKVFNAIQTVAEDQELDYVFDRSGDMMFLYAKADHDITYLVIEELNKI